MSPLVNLFLPLIRRIAIAIALDRLQALQRSGASPPQDTAGADADPFDPAATPAKPRFPDKRDLGG